MKLNLDYYKEELDIKTMPEEYEEVLEKVSSVDCDFSKTLDMKSKIKNILALSDIRENVLNWYDFKEDSSILELNANYGEITGLLCSRAKKVVSIEESIKFSKIIEKRHKNKENLEVIVGNIDNIKLNDKFDYIVIVGIVDSLQNYISYAKKYIKNDGKILIAVNNKFGVKSWISLKKENKVTDNDKTAISKNKLNNILDGLNYRTYYPLPDYKMPNIIYTEKCIPGLENIDRDLTYKDEEVNFKEVDSFKEIIKDDPNKFYDFANSFIVEASLKELEDNDIKFITFSNIRKDEYRIKTVVREKNVYKTYVNNKAKEHIEQVKRNIDILNNIGIKILDNYDDEHIISKYCTNITLDKVLIEEYKNNGIDGYINKIKEYENFLKDKLQLEEVNKNNIFDKYKILYNDVIQKLNFVKYGFWDLIFQNCFVINDEYYFYDQEWIEEDVPVEYIVYRAIKYFNEMKNYVSDTEIFEKLDYMEYIDIFDELDNKIQEKIREPLFWKIHTKEELVKRKTEELKNELDNYKKECDNLRTLYIQKASEVEILKNSFSWKVTKPLRKIRGLGNKTKGIK